MGERRASTPRLQEEGCSCAAEEEREVQGLY